MDENDIHVEQAKERKEGLTSYEVSEHEELWIKS